MEQTYASENTVSCFTSFQVILENYKLYYDVSNHCNKNFKQVLPNTSLACARHLGSVVQTTDGQNKIHANNGLNFIIF